MKRPVWFAIVLAIPGAFLVAAVVALVPKIVVGLRSQLMQYMAANLPAAVRSAIYEQMVRGPSFWDAVPDPDVAGLAQPNRTVMHTGVEVHINNAGLRAARDYAAKPDGVFRILCVGDSFVFGMGGREEDRFCDQLEAFYDEHNLSVAGRRIEAYAIGLPGWTLVQETTYLATRLTSYDPDLIIVLSVVNDITDNLGVTGVGGLSRGFSPEYRALGSSVFSNDLCLPFGDTPFEHSALAWDLSPESRRRWDKAMQRLKRLVEIQQGRGKQILVSAMVWGWKPNKPDAYAALFQAHFVRLGIPAPFVVTSLPVSPQTTLPHDSHPNRLGHRLLRDQYIHVLHRLGWVAVPHNALPDLPDATPVRVNPALDVAPYEKFRRAYLSILSDRIDFAALRRRQTRAFLGGVFPESDDPAHAREAAPWASVRAAFLLRRPKDRPLQGVEVEIEIPARSELFPFSLTLLLDGARATEMVWERPNDSGRYRISGAPVIPPFYDQVVEVTLETRSYFSTIVDPRMKSYRLLHARAF